MSKSVKNKAQNMEEYFQTIALKTIFDLLVDLLWKICMQRQEAKIELEIFDLHKSNASTFQYLRS